MAKIIMAEYISDLEVKYIPKLMLYIIKMPSPLKSQI